MELSCEQQSTVVVGIREDAEIEGTETLVFTINGLVLKPQSILTDKMRHQ